MDEHKSDLTPPHDSLANHHPPPGHTLPTHAPFGMMSPSYPAHSASVSSLPPSAASLAGVSHPPPHITSMVLPRGNLTLKERVAFDHLIAHHAALRRAAPTIRNWNDNNSIHATLTRNHIAAKSRNDQMKQAEIARQNTQMVTKITETVIKGKSPYGHASHSGSGTYVHKSLNLTSRKKEQARITAANLQLAQRIINKKTEIGGKAEWAKHAQKHERIHQNISRYIDVPSTLAAANMNHPQSSPYPPYLQNAYMMPPPGMLPPGVTPDMYADYLAQQHHHQSAAQLQPMPPPPAQPQGATPTRPLQPIPDAERRTARLTSKMIATEREKFAPSAKTDRLLRPLRRRSSASDFPAGHTAIASLPPMPPHAAHPAAHNDADAEQQTHTHAHTARHTYTANEEDNKTQSTPSYTPHQPRSHSRRSSQAGSVSSRPVSVSSPPPPHAPLPVSASSSPSSPPPVGDAADDSPTPLVVVAPRHEPVLVLRKSTQQHAQTTSTDGHAVNEDDTNKQQRKIDQTTIE